MKKTVFATLTVFATAIILLVAVFAHQNMSSRSIRVNPDEPFGSRIINRTNGTVEVLRDPITKKIAVFTVVAGDGKNHGNFAQIVQDAIESGDLYPESGLNPNDGSANRPFGNPDIRFYRDEIVKGGIQPVLPNYLPF